MVGPLAYLLKNRFYVGDFVYKGEVHKGEHEPILDRELFEAVQAQLTERKVWRKLARSKSSAILRGLIFDDRGHPMSPSHANKNATGTTSHTPCCKIGKPTRVQSPAFRRPTSRRLSATL
jgi:Recombinase